MASGFHDVHLEIHSAIDALDLVQLVSEHIARRIGLDDDTQHWTAMAIRESVVNAITHGNHGDPDKLVFIDFRTEPVADPTHLIVCVRDQGDGFDPAHLNSPLTPENVLKASGRGIFLIRQFMDEVTMRPAPDGGMEVRMLKRIRS